MKNYKFHFLFLVFLLVACVPSKKSQTPVTSSSNIPVKNETKIPNYVPEKAKYQESEEKIHNLLHTKLEVKFDWDKQYMYGDATLKLTPYFYPQDSLILDAQGFEITSVNLILKDNDDQPLNFIYKDGKKLRIKLNRTYTSADTFQINIVYTAKPNELDVKGSAAIYDRKGLYFINPKGEIANKPKQIWTQGETESASCWFPTIDAPNEKSTEEVRITVDKNLKTLSNGYLAYSEENGDGTKTDVWKQTKPHAPYLFMMAIGDFAVVEDSWKEIPVNYYVEKAFEKHAKAVFGNTPEMISFFSNKLGYDYPWDKYSQVVVRDFISGAMENTSASVFMDDVQITTRETLDENWDYIIAHELFHHWFGDLVTCESWSNLALNESFANYSEYLWYEHKYGKDYADHHRESELQGYLQQAKSKQYPIIRYHYNDEMEMFDRHSYNKGGLVLHMLRNLVGDQAFFRSLNKYLKDNEYKDVEIHELRLAFEDVTGKDLKWFFDQWFLEPGHPQIDYKSVFKDSTLYLIYNQKQDENYSPVFKLPIKYSVWLNGVKNTYSLVLTKKSDTIVFKNMSNPDFTVLDEEKIVLGEINTERIIEEWIAIYNANLNYQNRKEAIEGLSDYIYDFMILKKQKGVNDSLFIKNQKYELPVVDVLLKAIEDKSQFIRENAIQTLRFYRGDLSSKIERKIATVAIKDNISQVRSEALRWLDENDSMGIYKQIYETSLQDSSYLVLSVALQASLKRNKTNANEIIEKYNSVNIPEVKKGIWEYYTKINDTTKLVEVINGYKVLKPIDKIKYSKVVSGYLKEYYKSTQSKKCLDEIVNLAQNGKEKYERYGAYKILFYLNEINGVKQIRKQVFEKEEDEEIKGYMKRLGDL